MKQQIVKRSRAVEINKLHDEVCEAMKMAVQKAIRVGELLVEQKAECGHGNWLPWLEANVKFKIRSAQEYMRCYWNRDKYADSAYLTIRELAYGISKPSEEEVKEAKQREKELDDKAEELAKQRIALEVKEGDVASQKRTAEIELQVMDIDEDAYFNDAIELDESEEEFEERIRRFVELHRKFEGKKRDKQKLSEKQIADWAHKVWQAIIAHDPLQEISRERIAKATIKMLQKKYPRLMDEA